MTIIQMARDSGMELYGLGKNRARFVHHLESFAKLVEDAAFVRWAAQTKLAVQEEREACAKVCDWMQEKAEFHGTDCCKFPTPTDCAHVIRARGEA